jgi:hypothetical protein
MATVALDLESQLNLRRDSLAVVEFVTGRDGVVACDAVDRGLYWLVLRPANDVEENYCVRVAWERYPSAPPSVKFADAIGGRLDLTSAWPIIPGYRPGSFDICQPFTAEGFTVHAEWQQGPDRWPSTGNPFLWVTDILQRDLDNRYQGRSG